MARPLMDDDAAEALRQTVRDMAAFDGRPVTIGEAVRRLVAWWRNEPTPGRSDQLDGHAADHRTEAIST